jgi:hypothetical protein
VQRAEVLGDWVLVTRGLNNLVAACRLDDLDRVRPAVERLVDASRRSGYLVLDHVTCSPWLMALALADGDATQARALLERRIALDGMLGASRRHDGDPEAELALLSAEAGDVEPAVALHRRTVASGAPAPRDGHRPVAALVAAIAGEPGPALAWLASAAAAPKPLELDRAPGDLHRVAEAALRAGATAEEVAAAVAPLRAVDDPRVAAALAPVDAELASIAGEHERVIALLDPLAGRRPDRPRDALGRARMRRLLAAALAAVGRRSEASEVAQLAVADLARWPGFRRDDVERLAHVRARAGGGGAAGTRTQQRRGGPGAVHLPEDRRGARVEHPHQARAGEPHRDRRVVPAGAPRAVAPRSQRRRYGPAP